MPLQPQKKVSKSENNQYNSLPLPTKYQNMEVRGSATFPRTTKHEHTKPEETSNSTLLSNSHHHVSTNISQTNEIKTGVKLKTKNNKGKTIVGISTNRNRYSSESSDEEIELSNLRRPKRSTLNNPNLSNGINNPGSMPNNSDSQDQEVTELSVKANTVAGAYPTSTVKSPKKKRRKKRSSLILPKHLILSNESSSLKLETPLINEEAVIIDRPEGSDSDSKHAKGWEFIKQDSSSKRDDNNKPSLQRSQSIPAKLDEELQEKLIVAMSEMSPEQKQEIQKHAREALILEQQKKPNDEQKQIISPSSSELSLYIDNSVNNVGWPTSDFYDDDPDSSTSSIHSRRESSLGYDTVYSDEEQKEDQGYGSRRESKEDSNNPTKVNQNNENSENTAATPNTNNESSKNDDEGKGNSDSSPPPQKQAVQQQILPNPIIYKSADKLVKHNTDITESSQAIASAVSAMIQRKIQNTPIIRSAGDNVSQYEIQGKYFVTKGKIKNSYNSKMSFKGAVINLKSRISDKSTIGVFYSHGSGSITPINNLDESILTKLKNHFMGTYHSYAMTKKLHLSSQLSYGITRIKNTRHDSNDCYHSKTRFNYFIADLVTNYKAMINKNLKISPEIGMSYFHSRMGSLHEQEPNLANNISIKKHNRNNLSIVGGIRLQGEHQAKDLKLFPTIKVSYKKLIHSNLKNNRILISSYGVEQYLINRKEKFSPRIAIGASLAVRKNSVRLEGGFEMSKQSNIKNNTIYGRVNIYF